MRAGGTSPVSTRPAPKNRYERDKQQELKGKAEAEIKKQNAALTKKRAAAKAKKAAEAKVAKGKAAGKTIAATNINAKGVRKALGKGTVGAGKVNLSRPKTPPKPKSAYASAKKKVSNLDSLVSRRNKLTKGTPEYNRVQNKINSAYGKGPQRDASIKKATAKKAGPVSSGKKPTLKLAKAPAKPTQTPAQKRKAAAAKRKTGRKATSASRKTASKAKRGLAKSNREIKSIANKASKARKKAAIRRIRKG